ncbi:hypothetical protein PENSPDRAFT_671835 [Peniophora sp. CONT]|nr:hypothetical protein PENSPDRAFT_671835 [Peniophora sp. CONT]
MCQKRICIHNWTDGYLPCILGLQCATDYADATASLSSLDCGLWSRRRDQGEILVWRFRGEEVVRTCWVFKVERLAVNPCAAGHKKASRASIVYLGNDRHDLASLSCIRAVYLLSVFALGSSKWCSARIASQVEVTASCGGQRIVVNRQVASYALLAGRHERKSCALREVFQSRIGAAEFDSGSVVMISFAGSGFKLYCQPQLAHVRQSLVIGWFPVASVSADGEVSTLVSLQLARVVIYHPTFFQAKLNFEHWMSREFSPLIDDLGLEVPLSTYSSIWAVTEEDYDAAFMSAKQSRSVTVKTLLEAHDLARVCLEQPEVTASDVLLATLRFAPDKPTLVHALHASRPVAEYHFINSGLDMVLRVAVFFVISIQFSISYCILLQCINLIMHSLSECFILDILIKGEAENEIGVTDLCFSSVNVSIVEAAKRAITIGYIGQLLDYASDEEEEIKELEENKDIGPSLKILQEMCATLNKIISSRANTQGPDVVTLYSICVVGHTNKLIF